MKRQRIEPTGRSYIARWSTAAARILNQSISGLMTSCPVCGEDGMVFSQWVKGTSEKPLYMCHRNGSEEGLFCLLDRTQASDVRDRLTLHKKDAKKLLKLGTPYVLFSGGQDSLCLLHFLKNIADDCGVQIEAIHADTTAGFPEVENYVREVCRILEVHLHIVRPERDFFETAKKWGIPGPKSRWCCETLKVAPIRRFLQTLDGSKVIFDGIRAAESTARSKYTPVWYHPSFKCLSVSPVFYWSDAQVSNYLRKAGLPQSPAAKLGMSAECWCGAYQGRADFEALLSIHPEIYRKLEEVEKAQKGKYTFVYEKRQRMSLEEIRRSVAEKGQTGPQRGRTE